ncbi:MAG: gas vesicle protein K [Planctomycetota bacterium]
MEIDPENVRRGLGQLVLTVVKLLHELMERQALRRAEAGTLTEAEIEAVGRTLMLQADEIDELREHFGLDPEDLNLDLGPLGKVL